MARTARSISLTELEKEELFAITTKGTHKSRKIIRARVLLLELLIPNFQQFNL